jgi:hypothetical protein
MTKADKVRAYLKTNPNASPTMTSKVTGVSYGYAYKIVKQEQADRARAEVVTKHVEEATSTGKKPQTASLRQVGGDHYLTLSVEPWDAMRAWMTEEEFSGYLKGNVIKYLARTKGTDDLEKANHYLQKLIEVK